MKKVALGTIGHIQKKVVVERQPTYIVICIATAAWYLTPLYIAGNLHYFFFFNGVRRGGAKVKKMAEWKWHKKATQNRATFTLFQDKNKYSKMWKSGLCCSAQNKISIMLLSLGHDNIYADQLYAQYRLRCQAPSTLTTMARVD